MQLPKSMGGAATVRPKRILHESGPFTYGVRYTYMFPWIDPYEYVSVYLEVYQVSAEINPIHVVESSSTNKGTIPTNDISRKGGGN